MAHIHEDTKNIVVANLQLLGFNSFTPEDTKHRVKLSRDIFDVPNKAASEIVLYFLFHILDEKKTKEAFRHCWPVLDRRQEQEFRKTCSEWLQKLAKENSEFSLPSTPTHLLMSPSGEKFYTFLLAFSSLVLRKQIRNVDTLMLVGNPRLARSNLHLAGNMLRVKQAAAISHANNVTSMFRQLKLARTEWMEFSRLQERRFNEYEEKTVIIEEGIALEQASADKSGESSSLEMTGKVRALWKNCMDNVQYLDGLEDRLVKEMRDEDLNPVVMRGTIHPDLSQSSPTDDDDATTLPPSPTGRTCDLLHAVKEYNRALVSIANSALAGGPSQQLRVQVESAAKVRSQCANNMSKLQQLENHLPLKLVADLEEENENFLTKLLLTHEDLLENSQAESPYRIQPAERTPNLLATPSKPLHLASPALHDRRTPAHLPPDDTPSLPARSARLEEESEDYQQSNARKTHRNLIGLESPYNSVTSLNFDASRASESLSEEDWSRYSQEWALGIPEGGSKKIFGESEPITEADRKLELDIKITGSVVEGGKRDGRNDNSLPKYFDQRKLLLSDSDLDVEESISKLETSLPRLRGATAESTSSDGVGDESLRSESDVLLPGLANPSNSVISLSQGRKESKEIRNRPQFTNILDMTLDDRSCCTDLLSPLHPYVPKQAENVGDSDAVEDVVLVDTSTGLGTQFFM